MQNFISKKISLELESSVTTNAHGINRQNITNHLIDPEEHLYLDPMDDDRTYQFWKVLEEIPGEKDGYTIFFDPESEEFGLAIYNENNQMVMLGIYGTFIETLDSM